MTAEFDFDTHQEWAAKYNTPAPAAFTFTIGKVAAPQITWPTAASVKAGSPLSDSALSGGKYRIRKLCLEESGPDGTGGHP